MKIELAKEIVVNYEKHGWNLRRVLITSGDEAEQATAAQAFPETSVLKGEIDALWFSRASHGGREAWELRLLAEQPYALFEAFETDDPEEDREAARREMENKMRDYTGG